MSTRMGGVGCGSLGDALAYMSWLERVLASMEPMGDKT